MHDNFQLNNHVHFGAVIYLTCNHNHVNFYMCSTGIIFKSLINISERQGPIDPNMCLFTVCPPMQFRSEDFLEDILQNRYLDGERRHYDEKKAKVFIDQFEFNLKQNNSIKQQMHRYPIKYNEQFMLQHKFSSKYLSFIKDQDTNQYTLQLSDIPTRNCIFSLKACFNYQKDINTYIPFNSAAILTAKIHETLQVRQLFLNLNHLSIFDSWSVNQESSDMIKFGLYQSGQQIEFKNICYGESVWIFHLESGSFVKILQDEINLSKNILLEKIKYQLGYLKSKEEIQEIKSELIVQKSENQLSAEKFGLWKILYADSKQKFRGGKVKYDDEVRFYNVRYNSYLGVKIKKVGRNKFQNIYYMDVNPEPNTIFAIKSLSSSSQYVTNEDLFLIKNLLTNTYLTLRQPMKINQVISDLEPSQTYRKQDNFKFTKIDFLQEWQNNYILNVLPFLKEGIYELNLCRGGYATQRSEIILKVLSENLIELLSFSYDLTEGFQLSESKLGKVTFNHFLIQKLLKEQNILSQIMKILEIIEPQRLLKIDEDYMKKSRSDLRMMGMAKLIKKFSVGIKEGDNKQFKLQESLIRKIIDTCFKILRNCCKANSENALYAFSNIKIICKYLAMGTQAQKFMMDAFHDKQLLERISGEQFQLIINQYIKVNRITGYHQPDFFKLIAKFIRCGDKTFSKNQLQIFRLISMDKSLVISITQIDSQFVVNYKGMEIEINQFCSQNHQLYEFIASEIRLYALLCCDRNYLCSKGIKKIFPIQTIFHYLHLRETPEKIKLGFIWILMDTYLNERPRFKSENPLVFSIPQQLANEEPIQELPQFQKQINLMKNQGLNQQSINDIISCIHQDDTMTHDHIEKLKGIVMEEIEKITVEENRNLYSLKTETYLILLKYLIELGIFSGIQSKEVGKYLELIVENMTKSLLVVGETKIELQSTNFRSLLLEMVEKNVIKKFDYSAKYDGLEDEVKEDNICSIFVNYAFYQNILLQQKDEKQRKLNNSIIKVLLELITLLAQFNMKELFKIFVGEILQRQHLQKRMEDRSNFIKEAVLEKTLGHKFKKRQFSQTMLILLFYNSNSYKINFLTLQKLLFNEFFNQRIGLSNLNFTIFTVDRKEKDEFNELLALDKSFKLLSETSEIWLNIYQASSSISSKYDPVILLFINKIKGMIKIVMPSFNQFAKDPLSCIKYSADIDSQKQVILSNLKTHEQILVFLSTYRVLVKVVKANKQPYNRVLPELFKCCYLFLYVFIYDSSENKKKIHNVIKESYLKDFLNEPSINQLGETIFIIQYLNNNYEECLQFYSSNPEIFQKNNRYTAMHSRLLLKLLTFYDEPILANLKKFFISIFDFISFKKFLWFKGDNTGELFLDIQNGIQSNKQPLIYHINALQALNLILTHMSQQTNALKTHIRKSLSQEYLFKLLQLDDYYTKQTSSRAILKLMVHFKQKILKLIQIVYMSEDLRNEKLFFYQLKRQNQLLNKLIDESGARRENEDFRKIYLIKDMKNEEHKVDALIQDLYDMNFLKRNLLDVYLDSINQFCFAYYQSAINSEDEKIHKMAVGSEQICQKVSRIYQILHSLPNKKDKLQKYPLPITKRLFDMKAAEKDEDSILRKKYTSSILLELQFNKQIYKKINETEAQTIGNFNNILKSANLKQFSFLRKLSEFFEDAFEKLSNSGDPQISETLTMLIQFLTIWIRKTPKENVNQLRVHIGKSQMIFPILNFFETCKMTKTNKQLFLECLNFFNQLIGIQGNKTIQSIFNQYFTNKADSIEFFMKIKQLFDEINFEDKVNYKCKKINDSVQRYLKDSQNRKQAEFTLLNFLNYLCKGKFRENQIFLSSLSNISNFNIMSGIWEILKYQTQKYTTNLINVQNYDLITQCFATINELVKGPCVENQNQFLKKDFFLTILQYFQFQVKLQDLTLDRPIQNQLKKIYQISSNYANNLRIFLNSDKITYEWMPSQVKYICASLIASLLSENQNQEGKIQLYTFSPELIVREIDKVYQRYIDLGLDYTYKNMQVTQEEEVVLPLGFRLYELLNFYPPEKIPKSSPGLDFFRQKSRIVQVLHNDKISKIYFPHIPDEISDAFKTAFLDQVDRTSVNSKLRGLQQSEIQQRQSDYPYGLLLFLTVLALNITDIVLYNFAEGVPFVQFFLFNPILRFYGYNVAGQITSSLIILGVILSIIFMSLQIKGAVYLKKKLREYFNSNDTVWEKIKRITSFIWKNFHEFHYLFSLILFTLAAFNPFFDVILLLLEFYRRSDIFSNLIRAIASTLDQLAVVILLTLVCTYVLTGIFYYYAASVGYPDQCETLYYCFVFSIDNGLRADAGLVGYTDDEQTILEDYVTKAIEQVLLNIIYLFIIKVIIDQIIGAIMVDKFAELREAKEKIAENQSASCFICGLTRNLLDREQDGFQFHQQNYHNIWNYFQFLSYLRNSKLQNLSGIELYVFEEQKNGKLNWFPISRSWHLQAKSKGDEIHHSQENEVEGFQKQLDTEMEGITKEIHQIWELLNVKIIKQKSSRDPQPQMSQFPS